MLLASMTLEELCLRVNWMRMEACRMARLGFPICLVSWESPHECRLSEPGCGSVLAGGIPAERGVWGLEVQSVPPSRSGLKQDTFHRLC